MRFTFLDFVGGTGPSDGGTISRTEAVWSALTAFDVKTRQRARQSAKLTANATRELDMGALSR
jgi:hypothetical protein